MITHNRLKMKSQDKRVYFHKTFVGIDPGASGGIAMINNNKCTAWKYPKDDIRELKNIFKIIKSTNRVNNIICYIENVHAFPTDARSRAFAFGRNFGIWLGMLTALSLLYNKVTPSTWQKHFGPFPKEKKDRKNRIKEIAQEVFPDTNKITLATSDAILIALYAKEEHYDKSRR